MVVLGFIEQLGCMSGYDVAKVLEHRGMDHWADIKVGSIYHSIKKLVKDNLILEVECLKDGSRPEKTLYEITEKGRATFDKMQDTAFKGLYPKFYGFNLALITNTRRSADEIRDYAQKAMKYLDQIIHYMEEHEADHDDCFEGDQKDQKRSLKRIHLHMLQLRGHIQAERKWLDDVSENAKSFTNHPCKKCRKKISEDCVEEKKRSFKSRLMKGEKNEKNN